MTGAAFEPTAIPADWEPGATAVPSVLLATDVPLIVWIEPAAELPPAPGPVATAASAPPTPALPAAGAPAVAAMAAPAGAAPMAWETPVVAPVPTACRAAVPDVAFGSNAAFMVGVAAATPAPPPTAALPAAEAVPVTVAGATATTGAAAGSAEPLAAIGTPCVAPAGSGVGSMSTGSFTTS